MAAGPFEGGKATDGWELTVGARLKVDPGAKTHIITHRSVCATAEAQRRWPLVPEAPHHPRGNIFREAIATILENGLPNLYSLCKKRCVADLLMRAVFVCVIMHGFWPSTTSEVLLGCACDNFVSENLQNVQLQLHIRLRQHLHVRIHYVKLHRHGSCALAVT